MRWLHPEQAAWGLAGLIVLLGLAVRVTYKWQHRGRWHPQGGRQRRSGWARDALVVATATLSVLLLAAALTRPQQAREQVTPTYEPQDLVIVMDRSVSMQARDVMPSRAARAADEIRAFLERKPPTLDRIALVGFAGTSVVLSYPTGDLGSLFFYLDWVREDRAVLFGTDMGAALETALAVAARETSRLPPIFVVISDGDDQGTTLDRAAAAVRRAGIRLYTVGVGSDASVTIPVRDDRGRDDLLRDDDGNVLRTRLTEGTLRRLAAATGGQYFRSLGGGELQRALATILERERRITGASVQVDYADLHRWLLAGAGLLLLGLVALW